MDVLKDQSLDKYVRDVAAHLISEFPAELVEQRIEGAGVEHFVRNCIDRAGGYGIEGRSDVREYIEITLRMGPAFENERNVSEILHDRTLPGTGKMAVIAAELS